MSTHWLSINRSEFAEKTNEQERGRKRFISPYALPEAVRAYETDDHQYIIYEFKYIPIIEKHEIKSINNDIKFEIGENSKRIYRIIAAKKLLNNENKSAEKSVETMENALQLFIDNSTEDKSSQDSYFANKKIIHRYKKSLSSELSQ